MPNANEEFFDRSVRRAIGIERLKGSLAKQVLEVLKKTEADLELQLRRRLDAIRIRGEDAGPVRTKRIQQLLAAITISRRATFKKIQETTKQTMIDLAKDEVEWQGMVLQQTVPIDVDFTTPSVGTLRAAAISRPFRGAILSDWFKSLAVTDRKRFTDAVRLGIVQGETTDQIVRRVHGNENPVFRRSRKDAETVVLTALNHITNKARDVFYNENNHLISGLRWTAVLDGRTTPICRSRDGKVAPTQGNEVPVGLPRLDPPGARPPAHHRCRSVMVPVIDGIKIIGTRPTITDSRTRRVREISFRKLARKEAGDARWLKMNEAERTRRIKRVRTDWAKQNIGQVEGEITYEQWLRRQPAGFQDDVLGVTKGKLFRRGKLPLDKFVDKQTGREFTIKELRKKELDAFKEANLTKT